MEDVASRLISYFHMNPCPSMHTLIHHSQYFAFPVVFFNFDTDFIAPNCPGVRPEWMPKIGYYNQVLRKSFSRFCNQPGIPSSLLLLIVLLRFFGFCCCCCCRQFKLVCLRT